MRNCLNLINTEKFERQTMKIHNVIFSSIKAKNLDTNQKKIAEKLIRKLTQDKTSQVIDFCDEGYFHGNVYVLDPSKFKKFYKDKFGTKITNLSVLANVLGHNGFKKLEWLINYSEVKDFKEYERLLKRNELDTYCLNLYGYY